MLCLAMDETLESLDSLVTFSPGALKELEKTYQKTLAAQSSTAEETAKGSNCIDFAEPGELGLRLGVEGGGCAGMTYVLGFDHSTAKDLVFDTGLFKVYINKAHNLYLAGMEIDYQDGLNARGFTFSNPNASTTCGCGSSFGI